MTTKRVPDRVRYLHALRAAGRFGLHTSEIRARGLSGNPAARVDDLEERGFVIRVEPEHRDGRPGCRHMLVHDAGDLAARLTDGQLAARAGDARQEEENLAVGPAPARGASSTEEPDEASADSSGSGLFNLDEHRPPPRGYGSEEEAA